MVQKKELGLYPNKKNCFMETTFNNFESATDSLIFEDQQSDFATQAFFPGGEGEDEEEDDADESNAANEDQAKGSDDDNPPLDEDVVHSPLPTQGGGKPGKK
jgi:hypothetical protein